MLYKYESSVGISKFFSWLVAEQGFIFFYTILIVHYYVDS